MPTPFFDGIPRKCSSACPPKGAALCRVARDHGSVNPDLSDQTTIARTIVRGSADRLGWCPVEWGPGEEHVVRPVQGQVLACLWHLSDLHLCDAESPVRLEYLDRFGDPDSPYLQQIGHVGTYRPQEILTTQVAASMLTTVNRIDRGPATGRTVDAVLITGDLVDNAQQNELGWLIDLLRGGVVKPRSGDDARSSWVGAVHGDTHELWDERYWHPDGPPRGLAPDLPMRNFGFPTLPGLVDRARSDVHAPGVGYPLLAVHGNHDLLLQGTVSADARLREAAVSGERVTGLASGLPPLTVLDALGSVGPARYVDTPDAPREPVPADLGRALVQAEDFAKALQSEFVPESFRPGPGNCWSADVGELQVIALDTVNPHGGWQGSIDEGQASWLVAELDQCSQRYTVITTHHPSVTMLNDFGGVAGEARLLGEAVVTLLLDYPQVIAWLAGHVHHHNALWHGRPTGQGDSTDSGFWEITTASLIDWPQQARLLEFIRADGQIHIVSTVVDHDGHHDGAFESAGGADRATDQHLAGLSRLLAANDYHSRGDSFRAMVLNSRRELRNAVWSLRDPFPVQRL
jgi:metallophosphoesterase (TIGR03767 family)